MNLPLISQLPQDIGTAVLLIALVLIFVIAFKVMKMVFETLAVTVLSAGFYVALTQLFSYSFSFNQMLSYAFLGALLYMVYSFLASAYSLARTVLKIPYHLLMILLYPFKILYSKIKEEAKLRNYKKKIEKRKNRKETKEEKDESTKEVVLDKVKKDKDEN